MFIKYAEGMTMRQGKYMNTVFVIIIYNYLTMADRVDITTIIISQTFSISSIYL